MGILLEGYHEIENLTVIDFGNSVLTKKPVHRDGLFGAPAYMAPEIVEDEIYGPKADIWACGVIAYEVLSGFLPFFALNDMDILELIKVKDVTFEDPAWEV